MDHIVPFNILFGVLLQQRPIIVKTIFQVILFDIKGHFSYARVEAMHIDQDTQTVELLFKDRIQYIHLNVESGYIVPGSFVAERGEEFLFIVSMV